MKVRKWFFCSNSYPWPCPSLRQHVPTSNSGVSGMLTVHCIAHFLVELV